MMRILVAAAALASSTVFAQCVPTSIACQLSAGRSDLIAPLDLGLSAPDVSRPVYDDERRRRERSEQQDRSNALEPRQREEELRRGVRGR